MSEDNMTIEAPAMPGNYPHAAIAGSPRRTDANVRAVILKAVALKQVTEAQGESIFWLHGYQQDKNLTDGNLATLLKLSTGTVSLLFSGKYQAADWSGIVDKIEALKRVESEEAKKLDLGFVETATAKIVFKACDAARVDGMPGFIYGASQIGKTTALLEYARTHNHGTTKYIRMGSHWSKARFVRELAKACKRGGLRFLRTWELEDFIINSLNRYNLLIIDEFHLAMETVSDGASKEIVEFIREVYDRTGCGLVLSSTKVGLEGLENGKNKMLFDQLRRRGVVKIVLPDVPSIKDINAIARSFGLELPKGETLANVKQILKTRGLGVFIKYLQKAHSLKKGEEMLWEDFEYVQRGYAALATLGNDY